MTQETQGDPAARGAAPVGHMEDDWRSVPPQVYRVAGMDHWVVAPPQSLGSGEGTVVFTGAQAQHHALTYAHEKFGNARFFPY